MSTKVSYGFKGENAAAQARAMKTAAAMVTGVSSETAAALRALIARAIREGIPPYEAARTIKSMVGLTTAQAQAAMNYRSELLESGLSLQRVDDLVARYVEKELRRRAETIARTETLAALNQGALDAWKAAEKKGLLGPGAVKEWIVTPDDRLCPVCEPMDGVTVKLNAEFPGGVLTPPLHPDCRCAVAATEE